MGKSLMLAAMALPLLAGPTGVAQAGGGQGCVPTQFAVLECKSSKKGGFQVFAFSNDGDSAPEIEVGDDCADALNDLGNSGDGSNSIFFMNRLEAFNFLDQYT